mgnify:CR=1 FL=1
MEPEINAAWQRLQPRIKNWQISIRPGLTLTGLVILFRLLGLFQSAEWRMFDAFLRFRPAEPVDERVLIVTIEEPDIQEMKTYPVPDGELASLVKQLERDNPKAIGIDIILDLPVEPGHQRCVETLTALPNVFAIEYLDTEVAEVGAPRFLPSERVGFSDFPKDDDGAVRRMLMGRSKTSTEEYRLSLATRLAEEYLRDEEILLDWGTKAELALKFGLIEFPRVQSNTGGYIRLGAGRRWRFIVDRRQYCTDWHCFSCT